MQELAVVPVFMSAGAAVLPTVMAAVGSVVAVMLKPRELARLCRRRPWAMGGGVAVLVAVVVGVVWMERPAKGRAVRAKEAAGTDWAAVGERILAMGPVNGGAMGVNSGTKAPDLGTNEVKLKGDAEGIWWAQDFSRRRDYGGMDGPVGLTEVWAYKPEGGMFLATPAVGPEMGANGVWKGKRVYTAGCLADLGGYTGILACIDAETGKKVWEVMEYKEDVLKAFFSSPAVTADGKYVVVGQGLHTDANCELICFEAATGKVKWTVRSALHIESSPALFGDVAVVGAGAIEDKMGRATGDPGYVFGVRISDGKELWRVGINDPESAPVMDDEGIAYIGSGFNGAAVAAIRTESEEELKTKGLPRVVWKTALDYPATGPVTLAKGGERDLIIAGGGNSDLVSSKKNARGQVVGVDKKTGAVVWKVAMEDSVLGPMAYKDGVVICPCRNGEVAAVSTKDGQVLWKVRISGNVPVVAGCAWAGERIYAMSGDGYVAVLNAADGRVLEKVYVNDKASPGTGISSSSPVVLDGRLIVGTETGGMRCFGGKK
jgi:outer membrane protein assembly factor BamB